MKISEKILMNREQLKKYGPITIVALGDSVTHGAVADDEIDFEAVYHNRLRKKINAVRAYVPVTIINSGIGGTTAADAVCRLDTQVLPYNPDLVIVCFGLNDVNNELEDYLNALKTIFGKCIDSGTDVVFMTPNMLNTYVDENTNPDYIEYAKVTADFQNNGRMDLYMKSAVSLAEQMGVTVCDCYLKWKELSKTTNTTKLLANYINHPTREMHELFANSLFNTIFKDTAKTGSLENTMYNIMED